MVAGHKKKSIAEQNNTLLEFIQNLINEVRDINLIRNITFLLSLCLKIIFNIIPFQILH